MLTSAVALLLVTAPAPASAEPDIVVDANTWRVINDESGPVNYYKVRSEGATRFVHSEYAPPMKTTVLGYAVPEADRQRAKTVRWSWRAHTLPERGDECVRGKTDSAATVYLTWKRGLRYYTLKYVWSAVGTKGSVCDSKRNPFVAQDSVVVESGGPLGVWRSVEVDLAKHFRHHFAEDDPHASVPDFVGMAIMSDGDQTKSPSSADFGTFYIER